MADIKAVIFDLGSTLIHFEGEWHEVLTQSNQELLDHLHAAGIVLDGQEFLNQFKARLDEYYLQRESEFIEHTTRYLLQILLGEWGYPDVPPDMLESALATWYRISEAHWKTEEDAIPTLEQLRDRGYRLGLISNAGDDANVQRLVNQADLRPFFDIILSSAKLGIRKPNPRIFEYALNHFEIPPSQAVMVGDTLGADILGAQNAGIFAIWITRRASTPANQAHQDTIQPDAVIGTLSELPEALDSL
jgi:putative hydrolase of the HAD superfamily